MTYDADHVRKHYDARVEEEWQRLERTLKGQLEYHVHMAAIDEIIHPGDRVLELGAGAGRFSKEIARRAERVVVTDLSPAQLAFNRSKLEELGLARKVESWQTVDICDLSTFSDCSFDAVICIGGPLSYVFEQQAQAMREMLRVLRPNGRLLLGVMSLAGTVRYFLGAGIEELLMLGPEATDWLLRTGKQDGVHYRSINKHYCHMMRSEDVIALIGQTGGLVEKTRCAGFLSTADPEALQEAAKTPWLWQRLIEAELEFCQLRGLLDAGTHMIFTVRKPQQEINTARSS